MANTRQDLITLVLENLGVLAAGQSASIEDRSTVDRRIGPKLAELAKREVITGLDADNLDDGVFLYVADVIAYACRTPFGITGAKEEMLTKAAGEAEAALNGMARQYDAGTATSTVFDPVQAALEHLGVIAGGQSASEKDRAVVHARVQPLLMSLRGRDICGATDPSMLSESLKGEFAKLLALECVLSFPVF